MSTPFLPAKNGPTGASKRAETLFHEALDLPPGEREAFLREACGPDASLRAEVDGYLHHYEQAGSFLKEDSSASPELEAEFARLKPEEVGERIGSYKLLEQIGEGGFGTVWVAEQEKPIRRRVALKIIKLGMDTKEVIARFEQERQALALMDHPNIAKVLDAGATAHGRPFFVMELVRGVKITEYCDDKQLSTRERIELFITVCQAVQHAHQKGLIHRDLKPSNILVTINDGKAVPKVIDFGVAKATQGRLTEQTIYTQFQQMIGTPLYMSPEQAELTSLDIDTRSDIYSLGVLLYELLTGHTPIDQDTLARLGMDEIRRIIREVDPPRPSTRMKTLAAAEVTTAAKRRSIEPAKLSGALCGDLDWIVMKCLEKDRARRYDTANGIARDLERHLRNEVITARPPTAGYLLGKLIRRHMLVVAAGTAIAVSLVIGMAGSLWQAKRAREEGARARQAALQAKAAEQEQGRLRQLAVTAEKAQSEERKKAESEASKSGQVAQFLTDMLKGVGPSVALGRDTKLLREILDKTAERVGKDLKDQPEVEADLRSIIGEVYRELGAYEQARAMHTEALAIRKKRFGNEHPDVAKSLHDVAVVLRDQGKIAEAEIMHREALVMRRKLLGNEHRDVAASLNNLARVLHAQGKLAEAEIMHREALAMQRKLRGSEHREVAVSLSNLASVLRDQNKLTEAESMYRETLAMDRKLSGDEHPDVANSLCNLANVLNGQGKRADAEIMYREALAMQRELLGNEHPEVALSLNNLANLLSDQDKLAEAEIMQREAVAMQRKLLGNEHPLVATYLTNLAITLSDQGKLAEAETISREALVMQRKLLGSEHPDVAIFLNNLAVVLENQDKLAEAEATFREALAMKKRLLGNGHSDEDNSLKNLVGVLRKQGKISEAESLLREDLAMQRKEFGDEHPSVARSLTTLIELLVSQGRLAEAEIMSREALAIDRRSARSLGALDDSLNGLAEILFRQGKYADAEPLYRELVESREARLPSEDSAVLGAKASLARLLADSAWAERGSKSEIRNPKSEPSGARQPAEGSPKGRGGSREQIAQRAHEAERLLRECLASQLRSANPNGWRTDENRSRLGSALLAVAVTEPDLTSEARQAKFAEAESLMLEGNNGVQQSDKADREHKRDALTRLVRLYQTWNKPKQVAEWQRKLADFDKAAAKSASDFDKANADETEAVKTVSPKP